MSRARRAGRTDAPRSRPRAHAAALAGAAVLMLGLLGAPAALAAGPSASFGWSPKTPAAGQASTFTSTSKAGDNPPIVSQDWDFNGGRDSFRDASGSQVTHAFSAPGSYQVWLRVTDSKGATSVAKHGVTVSAAANQPPTASFTVAPASPVAGQLVTFTSNSSDAEGSIASLAWDLDGDGQFDDATGPTATRAFPVPGSYTVGLRVTDNKGAGSTSFRTLNVLPAGPPLLQAVVRIRGTAGPRGARIKLFSVEAPAGARVSIRCRHGSCAHRRISISRTAAATQATTLFRFRSLQRSFRHGTTLEVQVTKSGTIGKYTRLLIRSLKPPRRTDRCLAPGSTKPTPCPST